MKVVKPFRLGVMHRPFLRDGRSRLGLSVLAMAGLGDDPLLYPEPEMWSMMAEELGQNGVLDMGMPKVCAEFLVTGNAYTRHQDDKTACAVQIRVADIEKSLLVFGDRYWLDGRATPAQPFEHMPVDWSHAYGGPEHPANPLGMGAGDEIVNGIRVRRLPNVELPADMMSRPDRKPVPAGFGALDVTWPERFGRIGRAYDQAWLAQDFPGYARDTDWRLFNMAPTDQWWPHSGRIPDAAEYDIRNMHPQHPRLRGRLPAWRARCFLTRSRPEGDLFDGVDLRLTTAWFFPHRERVVLVYHGVADIAEDDAADVRHLMPVLEAAGEAPLPPAHYRAILDRRLDPDNGTLYMFRDRELVPPQAIGPWLDTIDPSGKEGPLQRNARHRADAMRADMRQHMIDAGQDPDRYAMADSPLGDMPSLDELPEFMEKMKQVEREQKAKLEAGRQELRDLLKSPDGPQAATGLAPGTFEAIVDQQAGRLKGPPSLSQQPDLQMMREAIAAMPEDGEGARESVALMQRMDEHERALRKLYRLSAHEQDAADAMVPARAAQIRQDLLRMLQQGRSVAGMDLTGADLSGLDLSGANLAGVMLENANLRGTLLDGADLSEAVLVRADLAQASLCGANLTGANMSLARCTGTRLRQAVLRDTLLEGLQGDGCDFSGSQWTDVSLLKVQLQACRFDGATFKTVMLAAEVVLSRSSFDDAKFDKVNFIGAALKTISFARAQLESCAFIDIKADGELDFSAAVWRTCCVVGASSMQRAVFRGARLIQCCLRGIDLAGADFCGARFETCDLSECGLQQADLSWSAAPDSMFVRSRMALASLRDANLIDTMLSKADLSGADMRGANLFRADLSQALLDDTTRVDGAYTRLAKTLPQRRPEAAA